METERVKILGEIIEVPEFHIETFEDEACKTYYNEDSECLS